MSDDISVMVTCRVKFRKFSSSPIRVSIDGIRCLKSVVDWDGLPDTKCLSKHPEGVGLPVGELLPKSARVNFFLKTTTSGNKRKVRQWQEVMKSKCGYCGFSGYQGFENRNNRRNCTLYSKNIPTNFQGETIFQKISADFL